MQALRLYGTPLLMAASGRTGHRFTFYYGWSQTRTCRVINCKAGTGSQATGRNGLRTFWLVLVPVKIQQQETGKIYPQWVKH